jgi:hypothetical protein
VTLCWLNGLAFGLAIFAAVVFGLKIIGEIRRRRDNT